MREGLFGDRVEGAPFLKVVFNDVKDIVTYWKNNLV